MKNYRVCYENGNSRTGTKVYEFYKYCQCSGCKTRLQIKREPNNKVTVTTKDISKQTEITNYLENWTCTNGNKWLEIEYIKF
jgi:hypothetical protein